MDALIVGAGPAGAALAYLLARRGAGVTLIERQVDFAREFRGEGLMPSGVDALEQMGLGSELDSLPHVHLATLEIFRGERRLASVGLGGEELGIAGPRIVSQPAMLEMLTRRAAEFPSFRLLRGVAVRDLVERGGRVAGVAVEGTSGRQELLADLVVGADGRSSVLRRRAGMHAEQMPQAFDIVWCKVPMPPFLRPPPATGRAYLGHRHAALVFPSYDDRLQIGWIIHKGAFGDLRARGVDAWIDEMRAHVSSDLSGHLAESRSSVTHPFVLDVVCDRLAQWTKPGLLLLGDAAHTMSPVGAQGINLALRDALVAANHLVPILTGSSTPEEIDAAAQRVRDERFAEIETIQRLQQAPPQILFGGSWWSRLLIDVALPFLLRTRLALPFALPTLRRLSAGAKEVKLVV
jgi:2-polyprenyl-6-methoxyphenol hydroxylase-like FAD-dependent oxidoreductase